MNEKKIRGITLIALVITIIILLILAGVAIATLTGENGVLTKAETAKEKTEEKTAEEKLQLVLGELVTDKLTDNTYNEKDYIDKKLTDNGMTPIGDNIVYVDGWQFEIDRSKPKIVQELGKGELEKQINIALSSTITSDYVSGTVKIEITYEGEIESITLNGNEITVPQKQDGKYVIEQQITDNGNYSVIARDKDGKFNIASTKVTDITEDMEIWNKEDMVAFRKKVNDEGRTFETKKAIVMADIDLKGSDADQWVPIDGFQGTFEGNYHTIDNLYIKSSSYQNLGLFTTISNKVTIQNMILDNVYVYNSYNIGTEHSRTAGIAGNSSAKIMNCGINSGTITAIRTTSNNTKHLIVGGIVGAQTNELSNCYNKATIKGQDTNFLSIGGIMGGCNYAIVSNCYNSGIISAVGEYGDIGGIVGTFLDFTTNGKANVNNSYNIGSVTGGSKIRIGGVLGRNGADSWGLAKITNCYCTTGIAYSYYYWNGTSIVTSTQGRVEANTIKGYATTLGDAFTSDTTNINKGYPILKWQIEK